MRQLISRTQDTTRPRLLLVAWIHTRLFSLAREYANYCIKSLRVCVCMSVSVFNDSHTTKSIHALLYCNVPLPDRNVKTFDI